MMYMGWDGVHSTTCNTGQQILNQTLGCSDGQHVVYEAGHYTCKTPVLPPACGQDEFLTYDGTAYSCKHSDVPACGREQVLTFDGSGFVCVNRTDSIPTCSSDQFLTYNGSSFQCATVAGVTWPTCNDRQVLSSDGKGPVCVDAPGSSAPAGTICGMAVVKEASERSGWTVPLENRAPCLGANILVGKDAASDGSGRYVFAGQLQTGPWYRSYAFNCPSGYSAQSLFTALESLQV